MKKSMTSLGVLLTFFGIIFALQGFNVLGGSAMSNTATWSILGPIIALIGLAMLVYAQRKPAKSS